MIKNVWDMQPEDVAIIGNNRYVWLRDFEKRYPNIGRHLTRVIVNINNPADKKLALRGFNVEIEEKQLDTSAAT